MRILSLRRRSLTFFVALTIIGATAALHLLVSDFPALADYEQVNYGVLAGKVVVIDPGHGGIDSGAKYSGIEEKDFCLALAQKVGSVLESYGATVIYTRTGDIDYYTKGKGGKRNDLLKRVEIINNSGANVYLSIHANAIAGARWSGAEVYYNPKLPENELLAQNIQGVLKNFPPGNRRNTKQDSDILVLKDTNIPGVLIEAGFLSNPKEAALLNDSGYQQKMAQSIVSALAYHFSANVAR